MWKGLEDPAGSHDPGLNDPPPSNQELADLKDQFEQQQTLIAQLKEMLRKTDQTSVSQEKVVEYANTLTKMNARAKRSQNKDGDTKALSKKGDTPTSETILLLRQQLEQNKVKLAERGKNQRGMENMVTQIKAQLDDSQHLISQTPINVSLIEDRVEYSSNSNSQDLYNILLNKDKRIGDLIGKINKLEGNVLDLQENIKEKDSVIDARTKAITLMTENLSKKGKNTLDALDETKEQMRAMQENFVKMEEEMKVENKILFKQLEEKDTEISELKLKNEFVNNEKVNLTEELEKQKDNLHNNVEIESLKSKILDLEEINSKLQISSRNSPARSSKRGKKGKSGRSGSAQRSADRLADLEITINEHLETLDQNKKSIEAKELLLNEKDAQIADLTLTIKQFDDYVPESIKLKQQLDESNKNMIKVKAQHKSKVKELNKKLDSFKKIGDVNAEVVRLEAENCKLNQKIAELEEEKGQLQLNMVDSKESICSDDIRELENKLSEKLEEITKKSETIASLQKNMHEKEEEITLLKNNVENLSALHNAQVKSDLTSIQFEEQLEKLEIERKDILMERDAEYKDLLNKFETLKEEKQEIASKLDIYMQENSELIDRLEKMSAEKVSSAESIEIVENLTQQEKIELEAYHKGLADKSSEHFDENPDLNDSINQLTEESSELLKRIELFNVERREVMEKMETLTTENNQLSFKFKEIENNRDVLVETYEQLQTEKEELDSKMEILEKSKLQIEERMVQLLQENTELKDRKTDSNYIEEYKSLIEIQQQEIKELKVELLSRREYEISNDVMLEKINALESQYTNILIENEKLKNNNSDLDSSMQERIYKFETKIKINLAEIENYKIIIEENKAELIKYSNVTTDLQDKLKEKSDEIQYYQNEVTHLNSIIEDLNLAISKLEEENQNNAENNVKLISIQLEDLKMSFNDNLQQTQDYERELEQNSEIIKSLNLKLQKLNNKITETEQLLNIKDAEIKLVIREKEEIEKQNIDLNDMLKEKDNDFHKACEELKSKCVQLQLQIEENTGSFGPLETKVQTLEMKNKDQLEKMKKIAANLKKKTIEYKELETNHFDVKEKWEFELKENEEYKMKITESESKLQSTLLQLHEVKIQLTKLQSDFDQKNHEFNKITDDFLIMKEDHTVLARKNAGLTDKILHYSAQIEDLQNINHQYENQVATLSNDLELVRSNVNNFSNTELSKKDEIILGLNEELETAKYNIESTANALKMKICELEMYIETQDFELARNIDRVAKLEEGLSKVEKRRLSLEHKTIQLGSELHEKGVSLSESEDYLELRLKSLVERDEELHKKLKEITNENKELTNRNKVLDEKNDNYKKQLNNANMKLKESNKYCEELNNFEIENTQLNDVISNLEGELKRTNMELNHIKFEIERNESDMQEQIEQFMIERKLLMEQFELSSDQVIKLTQSKEDLTNEIRDLNVKFDQQQIVFDENINKYRLLEKELNINLSTIQMLNLKLETINKESDEIQADQATKMSYLSSDIFGNQDTNQTANFFDNQTNIHLLGNNQTEKLKLEKLLRENKSELIETKTQLEFVKNMMKQTEEYNFNILGRNDELEKMVIKLKVDLEKFQNPEIDHKSTVLWPDSIKDPFEFVNTKPDNDHNHSCGNTEEELIKKIKTLEFMLYNVEKEKDNALLQCHEMSNELTRLVYERENKNQINIKSQIMVCNEVSITAPNLSAEIVTEQPESPGIVEMECVSKTVSLCYPETQIVDTFGENDDGWGWGPEDGKLDEEHIERNESTILENVDGLKQQFNNYEDLIRVLECERENHLEEIKQAQIKSGKLIKKLKAFKVKNDQLTAKLKSDGFDDLDDAIQEEFKAQIVTLEKKIRDTEGELEKEKLEKENLQKRNEILSSANERMVEMKEKQDSEVMFWQHSNRELSAKLEQLEWGDDNFEPKSSNLEELSNPTDSNYLELAAKIKELNDQIKELTLDNEDLQAMLEEQRNMFLQAEKSKLVQPITEHSHSKIDYDNLLSEKMQIYQQLQLNYSEKTQLEASILESNITIDTLNQQLKEMNDALITSKENEHFNNEWKQKFDVLESEKNELLNKNNILTENNVLLLEQIKKVEQENADFVSNAIIASHNHETEKINLLKENDNLKQIMKENELENANFQIDVNLLNEKEAEITKLQLTLHEVNLHKNQLEVDLKLMAKEENINLIIDSQEAVKKLNLENKKLQDDLKIYIGQENNMQMLQEEVARKNEEIIKLKMSMDQLVEEWSKHVDQRGNDVAESWKLHVETREHEFKHLEEQLHREIQYCEEKCNALVNENNELRKNVDAEIRNEIDRISSLQQQISELTNLVQQKQIEIDKVKSDNIQHTTHIIDLNKFIKENTNKFNELSSIIEDLTLKLNGTTEMLETIKLKLSSKEDEVTGLNSSLEQLKQKTNLSEETDKTMNNLQLDLREKQSELKESKLYLEEYVNQIEYYKTKLSNLEMIIKEKEAFKNQIDQCKINLIEFERLLQEKDYKISELTAKVEVNQLENVSNLNLQQQVSEYQQQVDNYKSLNEHAQSKDFEISRLNILLQEKEQEYEYNMQSKSLESQLVVNNQAQEIESLKFKVNQDSMKYEELIKVKDTELQLYKHQLHEYITNRNMDDSKLQEELNTKETQLIKLDGIVCDDEKQLLELKGIIEEQVLKIEELNKALYEKSSNYDSLIAELNISQELHTPRSAKHVQFEEDDLAEPVSRAELDLALYMLHQRDVRCEELTVELMQLLEERDTLQLRLSNALREKEELRTSHSESAIMVTDVSKTSSTSGTLPKSKTANVGADTELMAETVEIIGEESLASKLSELKMLGYNKDKTLMDDQQLRRIQQFSILQQHKDEVSRLPAEAAARLVDASYTLSRDVQSPSKVLLNWLWGKSIPKVNNI